MPTEKSSSQILGSDSQMSLATPLHAAIFSVQEANCSKKTQPLLATLESNNHLCGKETLYLLHNGAELLTQDEKKDFVRTAVYNGDIKTIEFFQKSMSVEKWIDFIKSYNKHGLSLIHAIALSGKVEIMNAIFSNIRDPEICVYLLSFEAKTWNFKGMNSIHCAVLNGQVKMLEFLRNKIPIKQWLLLINKPLPKRMRYQNQTALFIAATHAMHNKSIFVQKKYLDCMKFLISQGANRYQICDGITVFHKIKNIENMSNQEIVHQKEFLKTLYTEAETQMDNFIFSLESMKILESLAVGKIRFTGKFVIKKILVTKVTQKTIKDISIFILKEIEKLLYFYEQNYTKYDDASSIFFGIDYYVKLKQLKNLFNFEDKKLKISHENKIFTKLECLKISEIANVFYLLNCQIKRKVKSNPKKNIAISIVCHK